MEDVSVLSLLGRLIVSLAIVLGLMALLARFVRNRTLPGLNRATVAPGTLQVMARQPLSRTASVVLVRAADRAFILGVTDAAVSLLAEMDPGTLDVQEPVEGTPTMPVSVRDFVNAVRDRSVRRT